MEMHLVHIKNNMSIEDALKESDGLVVMSFIIKKTKGNNQASGWNILAKFLKDIPEKGNSKNLNGEFSLGSLWREADVHHYFYYNGSLTSLPGAKSVILFVFAVPLEISYQV
ncbi:carbonic anhydrase 6-like, partial [Notechis scutatus]|uniref:Carbonic anhydrase 6-like n=1 Tax=Notechis scutatus TaxID=8663 RepID=A0A6J1W4M8_9SAUR